jgi:hypothetical protein
VLHGDLESTGADNAMNPVEAAVLASRQAALAMEAKREEMSRGLEAGGQEVARAMKARQEDVVRAGEGMARALKGSGMGLVNNVDRCAAHGTPPSMPLIGPKGPPSDDVASCITSTGCWGVSRSAAGRHPAGRHLRDRLRERLTQQPKAKQQPRATPKHPAAPQREHRIVQTLANRIVQILAHHIVQMLAHHIVQTLAQPSSRPSPLPTRGPQVPSTPRRGWIS